MITRIVVADVSGHGASVAEFSTSLRSLLRKNINQKSQRKLVEKLNRQFAEMAGMQRFATALVMTYLASHDRLVRLQRGASAAALLPSERTRPGRCCRTPRAREGREQPAAGSGRSRPDTRRSTSSLGRGDLVVFYTDALSEAANPAGKLLGEEGLLEAARRLDLSDCRPGAIGSGAARSGRPASRTSRRRR